MNHQRRTVLNIVSSIVQVATSTLLLLVLYRYLADSIGVEGLGIWSLVLAIGSATQIANLGLPGTITKFVADYQARGLDERIRVAVQTAVLSIAAFGALLTWLAYPLGTRYLQFVMPAHLLPEALGILPVALLSFWLAMYGSTYQSALMGLQRYAEANAVMILDSILQLILCLILVPNYGLWGLVMARLSCNVITLVLTVTLSRHFVPGLPWIPARWGRAEFREMIGYAGGLQLISLLVIFADPVTKGLIGRFGSLTAVGYYEMADKLIKAVRALLIGANQVTLPKFAVINAGDRGHERTLYASSQNLNSFFALPAFALLTLAAPLVSVLWLGRQEPFFVLAMGVLSAGWLFNVLALPTYFASLGAGEVRANVVSHVVLAGANVFLGWSLGLLMGASGVVLGWSLALVLSSMLLVIGFGLRRKFGVSIIVPESQRVLGFLSLLAVSVALGLNVLGFVPTWYWPLAAFLALAIVILAYFNDARREIFSSLGKLIDGPSADGPIRPAGL